MANKLSALSLQFATDVILMCDGIHHRAHIKNQILRSACSIGANIHEAQYGYSRNDFICKLQIALKEANETDYWLRLLNATDFLTEQEFESLRKDIKEIISILVSITKTTKQDLTKNK